MKKAGAVEMVGTREGAGSGEEAGQAEPTVRVQAGGPERCVGAAAET